MEISIDYGVRITHNETCFKERVPREVLTITNPNEYNSPLFTLYLTLDELKMINQVITEYIKQREEVDL